jgi:hypothetical protein
LQIDPEAKSRRDRLKRSPVRSQESVLAQFRNFTENDNCCVLDGRAILTPMSCSANFDSTVQIVRQRSASSSARKASAMTAMRLADE